MKEHQHPLGCYPGYSTGATFRGACKSQFFIHAVQLLSLHLLLAGSAAAATNQESSLTWPGANYFHVNERTKISFTLTPKLACPLNFDLTGHEDNFEISIPAGQVNLLQELNFNEQADDDLIFNLPGELQFNVSNAVNQTVTCAADEKGTKITTVLSQFHYPKLRLFYYSSHFMYYLCIAIGWIYFFAWSISFYPQVQLNHKRQSTSGLNVDFVLLNIIGFGCYGFYNFMLYYDDESLSQYFKESPENLAPVALNDVVFAIHAFVLSAVTLFQVYYYSEDKSAAHFLKQLTLISKIFCPCALVYLIYIIFASETRLKFLYNLSYIKIVITIIKYIPQAVLNYKRKSTSGFSIYQILLDLTGGLFSILQMVIENYNFNVNGFNPAKFAIGSISLLFDFVFITQHYVLYRNNRHPEEAGEVKDPEEAKQIVKAGEKESTAMDSLEKTNVQS